MSWYAVHTKSRHEDKAAQGLAGKGYEVFLPKMEVWSARKDRRKKIFLPMFSGYLFVAVDDLTNEARVDILKTFGVVRILGKPFGIEPIPVPDGTIDAIRRIVSSRVEIQQFTYPKVGERARITDGAFAGIEGTVVSIDAERELFVVTIELLQRAVAIKLEGFQIAKL